MRRYALLAVALGLACAAAPAKADFVLSDTAALVGDGTERINFYARNTGTSGSGSKVVALDLTLAAFSDQAGTKPANLVIKFVSTDADSTADLTGAGATDPYHSDRSFINLLGNPPSNPSQFTVVDTSPKNTHDNYSGGVTHFEMVGAQLFHPPDGTVANNGRGALVAVAVLEGGGFAKISGLLGGDVGPPFGVSLGPVGLPVPLPGDANGDGVVDFVDFLAMAQHYGKSGGLAEGDFNGDGQVGFDDLLILSQNFGRVQNAADAAVGVPDPAGVGVAGMLILTLSRRIRSGAKRCGARK